jgi:isocitrate dehydrogenase
MADNDFFATEQSYVMDKAGSVRIEYVSKSGEVKVLKNKTPLLAGEVIDASCMRVAHLRQFFAEQISDAKEKGVLFSLHLKATMMKVSDPIMFGHCVEVFFADVFSKHQATFDQLGVSTRNGFQDVLDKIATLPDAQRAEIEADIEAAFANGPDIAMVDSSKGITNLHVPNDVIIDASMPPVIRDSGKMWNKDDGLQDCKMVIPDRSYATMYDEIVNYCRENGGFDASTMGNVSNVGLMAQKAEEYGSHDKTFEAPAEGSIRVIDSESGNQIFEHEVSEGDIWRMAQTKDSPIQDWVKLAVSRAKATGNPAIFWLNEDRAHDRSIIAKVNLYLADMETAGLDIRIRAPQTAMKETLDRVAVGEDTISVTGNVLRDYLTDLFPILELGTSAKMLSIVPLLAGGGLFETGAGGSAPKHVQQMEKEGHLRWDSLGEFLALAVSLEDLGNKTGNAKAKVMAETLNSAIGELLEQNKSPGRKVGQLDNRGSHFFVAKFWSEALASQSMDGDLAAEFAPIAATLNANEEVILSELSAKAGTPIDLGGWFMPDEDLAEAAMRPSATLNGIIDGIIANSIDEPLAA